MPAYEGSHFHPPAPLARVGLRHPEKGPTLPDVLMLIDSGADVTLLPLASIDRLGVTVNSGEGYELMGFDGNRTVSHTVQVDLLFLRRVFEGRFLLIDQEWGILGRDVRNHLALLLHGPSSTWSEYLDMPR